MSNISPRPQASCELWKSPFLMSSVLPPSNLLPTYVSNKMMSLQTEKKGEQKIFHQMKQSKQTKIA